MKIFLLILLAVLSFFATLFCLATIREENDLYHDLTEDKENELK